MKMRVDAGRSVKHPQIENKRLLSFSHLHLNGEGVPSFGAKIRGNIFYCFGNNLLYAGRLNFCKSVGTVHWRLQWWLGPHSCFTGRAQVNVLCGTRNQLIMFGAGSKAGRYRTPAAHVHPISLSLPQRFFPCRLPQLEENACMG